MNQNPGPMILLRGEAYPYGRIKELDPSYDGERRCCVRFKDEMVGCTVSGTVAEVAADINAQLADHARACAPPVFFNPESVWLFGVVMVIRKAKKEKPEC